MQIFASAHTTGPVHCCMGLCVGRRYSLFSQFHESFNLPKNIIWRQSVKTATTTARAPSGAEKNYRIFNKQQQYQNIMKTDERVDGEERMATEKKVWK